MDIAFCRKLTRELMDNHGLHHWGLQFRNLKRLCGYCSHRKRLIALGKYYVENNDPMNIRDTVLHEIAHALVGPGHKHNHVWKAKAIELGCRPVACNRTAVTPPGKYQATCPTCGKKFHKHRNRNGLEGYYCLICGPVRGQLTYRQVI